MALPFWYSRPDPKTTCLPLSSMGPTLESWFVDKMYGLWSRADGRVGDVVRLRRLEHDDTGEVVWIIWVGESSYVCWASKENRRAGQSMTDMEAWWARLEEARTVKIEIDFDRSLLLS